MRPYYEQDGITIYHGDCREILPTLPGVDLVLTDPPYASGARRDADRQVRGSMLREFADEDWFSHDSMTTWGFSWFLRGVMTEVKPLLAQGAHIYVFTDWRQQPNVYGLLEATGYRVNHSLVWDKEHFGMGAYWRNQHEHIVFASHGTPQPMRNRGMGSVIRCKNVRPDDRVHPTEKPSKLLRSILEAAPEGLVLDPFMGSGTTLRAAKDLNRKAIGIEIEERYCEIAAKRLQQSVMVLA
jgi:site-specific DNA-methyltransferase (adenine-specific)